jgi:peptidoglycan/LPS O-acetylase OafA/YrhL
VTERIPALDGLRGIAIALVLIRHFVPPLAPNAGIVGVDVFFALSGFLITTLLLDEHRRGGAIRLGAFWARRGFRLLPALGVMLAVYLAYVAVTGRLGAGQASLSAGMAVGYVFNFGVAAGVTATPLGPLWTLSVEEQFYLLWPLALICVLRCGMPARRLMTALMVVIGGLWLLRPAVWMLCGGATYTLTTTWADALLAGALVAIVRRHDLLPRTRTALLSPLSQTVCWLIVVAAAFLPEIKSWGVGYTAVLPALCVATALIVWATADRPAAALSRAPTWSVLRRLGVLSYSLYLWNYLVREAVLDVVGPKPVVALAVGLPVTFVLAAGSFYLVERPVLRWGKRLRRRVGDQPEGGQLREQRGKCGVAASRAGDGGPRDGRVAVERHHRADAADLRAGSGADVDVAAVEHQEAGDDLLLPGGQGV